jgi:ATP-dependent DNA helicase RecG
MKSASLVTYPHKALREAIVNAVYHRGYEPENSSSTKVSIRPHCLEITSYPGPNPSLKQEEFTRGSVIPPVQARNRRIGEFLRQLNLAEARGTGVQTLFRIYFRIYYSNILFRIYYFEYISKKMIIQLLDFNLVMLTSV